MYFLTEWKMEMLYFIVLTLIYVMYIQSYLKSIIKHNNVTSVHLSFMKKESSPLLIVVYS